jgi:hypothetical protein
MTAARDEALCRGSGAALAVGVTPDEDDGAPAEDDGADFSSLQPVTAVASTTAMNEKRVQRLANPARSGMSSPRFRGGRRDGRRTHRDQSQGAR